MKSLPKPFKGGKLIDWAAKAWEAIRRNRVIAGPGIQLRETSNGTVISVRKTPRTSIQKTECPFGQIITIPAAGESPAGKGIRGGLVTAGDANWNVEANELNLSADGEFLVWLEVGVTANNEDGLPLPGLETSTEPTWAQGAVASGYPATTQPDIAGSFLGTAIVPLGTLTIADGRASFEPTGCGSVSVGYCPNNISIARA